MNVQQIIVTLIAAIATALMLVSFSRAGVLAIPVFMLLSFPTYVATLSFGSKVGILSAIFSIIIAYFAVNAEAACLLGLMFTLPAAFTGYHANLAQLNNHGKLQWYPLSLLFFNLCLAISLGISITLIFFHSDPVEATTHLKALIEQLSNQNPELKQLRPEEIDQMVVFLLKAAPFILAGFTLILHVANLYFAALVSRASKLFVRPQDDIPRDANLPTLVIPILVVSLFAAIYFDGNIQIVASVTSGTFMMALALIGLCSIHYFTRGKVVGLVFLTLSYLLIILVYVPIYLFSLVGIYRVLSNANKYQVQE